MPFIIDKSVVSGWYLENRATPYTEAIAEQLREDRAVVPALWELELTNVLRAACLRQRMTAETEQLGADAHRKVTHRGGPIGCATARVACAALALQLEQLRPRVSRTGTAATTAVGDGSCGAAGCGAGEWGRMD